MKDMKSLKVLLKHKENDPLNVIKVGENGIKFYVNINYCCWNTIVDE